MTEELAERIADTMFALATPSRVRILGCLRERPHTVGELIAATAWPSPPCRTSSGCCAITVWSSPSGAGASACTRCPTSTWPRCSTRLSAMPNGSRRGDAGPRRPIRAARPAAPEHDRSTARARPDQHHDRPASPADGEIDGPDDHENRCPRQMAPKARQRPRPQAERHRAERRSTAGRNGASITSTPGMFAAQSPRSGARARPGWGQGSRPDQRVDIAAPSNRKATPPIAKAAVTSRLRVTLPS